MSALFSPMMDPRLLPATLGPSEYPPGTRFIPCPANSQPWGHFHVRPIFLALKPCKKKTKPGAFLLHCRCTACGFQAFFSGAWWGRGGVTREEIVAQYGRGIAADDNNGLL